MSAALVVYPQIATFLFQVKDPEEIPIVMNAIRIFALSYVGSAITFLYTFYAEEIQNNKLSNRISLLEGLILPVGFASALSFLFGPNGIWISFTIAEVFTIFYLFVYSKYVNRKTGGEYTGFFINKHNDGQKILEHTINEDVNEAVDFACAVKDLLSENESSHLASLAIEKTLVNIININEEIDTIDVIVRDHEVEVLILIKDLKVEFDLIAENDDDDIIVLNTIADEIACSRVLGLNSTEIIIKTKTAPIQHEY